mgnify:CR=1 FL=1
MFQSLMMSAFVLGQAPVTPAPMVPPVNLPIQANPVVAQPAMSPYTATDHALFVEQAPKQEPKTSTIVGTPYPLKAASDDGESSKFSGSVTLNQDSFFGFYPILNGSYAINDRIALTFYGLFWTNPGFTPSGTGGTGLWTEFAAGISFTIFDGAVTVNPAFGFLSGALLSGADRSIPFEGVVSQISFSHAGKYTEGQIFAAYYTATSAPSNNDFFHWWTTAGFRPFADSNDWTQIVSLGAHFEQLHQTKAKAGETSNIYTWIGPYIQLTLPNDVFIRVNAGWDLQDNVSGNFYKTTLGYVF